MLYRCDLSTARMRSHIIQQQTTISRLLHTMKSTKATQHIDQSPSLLPFARAQYRVMRKVLWAISRRTVAKNPVIFMNAIDITATAAQPKRRDIPSSPASFRCGSNDDLLDALEFSIVKPVDTVARRRSIVGKSTKSRLWKSS